MAQKWPKMAPKLAPAEKNSTDISAASATFCISVLSKYWMLIDIENPNIIVTNLKNDQSTKGLCDVLGTERIIFFCSRERLHHCLKLTQWVIKWQIRKFTNSNNIIGISLSPPMYTLHCNLLAIAIGKPKLLFRRKWIASKWCKIAEKDSQPAFSGLLNSQLHSQKMLSTGPHSIKLPCIVGYCV